MKLLFQCLILLSLSFLIHPANSQNTKTISQKGYIFYREQGCFLTMVFYPSNRINLNLENCIHFIQKEKGNKMGFFINLDSRVFLKPYFNQFIQISDPMYVLPVEIFIEDQRWYREGKNGYKKLLSHSSFSTAFIKENRIGGISVKNEENSYKTFWYYFKKTLEVKYVKALIK